MWRAYDAWIHQVTFDDPIERQQSGLVQSILIGLCIADLVSIMQTVILRLPGMPLELPLLGLAIGMVTAMAALWIVRRGHFRAGVLTATLGMLSTIVLFSLIFGVLHTPLMLLGAVLPLMLSGLLAGRGTLLAVGIATVAGVAAVVVLESQPVPLAGQINMSGVGPVAMVSSIAIILALMCLFLDRFRGSLRSALETALVRERELEQLQLGLEQTVAARTAELQATVDQLQASQATIRELGAPVLPVLPGVLVAPLIGALDTARAADLSAAVLAAIDRTRARYVILDITGVPVVDTHVARALLRVTQAAQLLGASTLLVGVKAEVAQTMATLGIDLGSIRAYPNLQEAVGQLLERSGLTQST